MITMSYSTTVIPLLWIALLTAAPQSRAASAADTPSSDRWADYRRHLEACERAGDRRAAREASAFPPEGATWDEAPPATAVLVAQWRLEAGDTTSAEIIASLGQTKADPGSAVAAELRWTQALASARRGAGADIVAGALAGAPMPSDSPDDVSTRRTAAKLAAFCAAPERWIRNDTGSIAPPLTERLRAAGEFFAAGRHHDAYRLHYPLTARDQTTHLRAYATLQCARSLVRLHRTEEALGFYRRFLTDPELGASDYAPAALIRAGHYADAIHRHAEAYAFYTAAFANDDAVADGDMPTVALHPPAFP